MIYLDNAATTKVLPEIVEYTSKFLADEYFNPSSVYEKAVNVRKEIETYRKSILSRLFASNHDLVFTSGATEANNLVFNSVSLRAGDKIIISAAEHPSVYNTANCYKNKGVQVEVVNLTPTGEVDVNHFKSLMDKDVKLVSIMMVSNETGVINDIKRLCAIAKGINPKVLFACDGVQAFGKIDVLLDDLDIDFFVLSAHKIHGPKGIGALVYRKDLKIVPMMIGGGQESGLRSGTENVFGIMGLYLAVNCAYRRLNINYDKVLEIKNKIIDKLINSNVDIIINGEKTSPYILSISVPGIRGEVLLHMLEEDDILISTGSACSSRHFDNRVLEAMGRTKSEVMGSVRISFNAYDEIDSNFVADKLLEKIYLLKEKI